MGIEGMLQIGYTPSYSLDMFIKYFYKNKAQNFTLSSKEKYVIPYIRQRIHCQLNYSMTELIQLKTFADINFTNYRRQNHSKGYLLGLNGKWGRDHFPLKCCLGGAWFTTDGYDTRNYVYEPGLLYSYSMYSFYGQGVRLFINMGYTLKNWFILQAKWGWTHYLDRNRIGSSLEEIRGNNKIDLQLQLKFKW